MKKIIFPILSLAIAVGCAPVNKKVDQPQPIAVLVKTDQNEYKVVEVITKPVLISRKNSSGQPALVKVIPNTDTQVTVTSVPPDEAISTEPVKTNNTGSTTKPSNTTAGTHTPINTSNQGIVVKDAPIPRLTLDNLKRVDTSSSTAPLLRLIAMKLNGIPYQKFAGYGAIDFTPELPEGVNPDAMTNDILAREPSPAADAIQRLTKKEVDLIILTRKPTDAEIDVAAKSNVTFRVDQLATEALVFSVNNNNPTINLSHKQLQEIFTGKYEKWSDAQIPQIKPDSELAAKPLTVAYRAKGLGTEELMSQILLDGKPVPELPISRALSSGKLVLDATTEDNETIGFSVYAYAANMTRDGSFHVLAVDGIMPEPVTLMRNEYPLTTQIYVITRDDLESTNDLFGLRTWMLAMNGQKLIAEAGYLPYVHEAWTEQRLTNSGK